MLKKNYEDSFFNSLKTDCLGLGEVRKIYSRKGKLDEKNSYSGI